MLKKSYRYNIILKPEPEGGYTVVVPSLPGCITYGKDLREAREMVRDAISGYVASLRRHHEPIPTDTENLFSSLDFSHA